jgi:hypothetical protein
VLRGISEAKREKIIGTWRKMHNEDHPPRKIRVRKSRRMRWRGHVARMGKKRYAYRVLVGKTEGRRPPERLGRRWEDNIKINLRKIRYGVWTRFVWLGVEATGGLLLTR